MFNPILLAAMPIIHTVAHIRRAAPWPGNFPRTHRWYRLDLPGALCADGSPYCAYLKKGTLNKTVVCFSGGGASWNAYTAARPITLLRMAQGLEGYYFPHVRPYLELTLTGLLTADDSRNPFQDWNFLYLPYASGDFHVGDAEVAYTDGRGQHRVLHHHGARNVAAALERTPKEFFGAEQVLICGDSGGAFGCVAHAPQLADRFPHCRHFLVYADGSQVWSAQWPDILKGWNAEKSLISALGDDGQLIRDWFLRLHRALGDRAVCLHCLSTYDKVLASYQNKLNHDDYSLGGNALGEYHGPMVQAVETLQRELPGYHRFFYDFDRDAGTGATVHTIMRSNRFFYEATASGDSVAAWLRDATEGKLRNVGQP